MLGQENYLRMRERFDLQMEFQKISNGIYVGQGCMAHMRGSEENIFIQNPIRKEAWALDIENKKERTKGASLENLKMEIRAFRCGLGNLDSWLI